ncbi:Carboxylate-amine ligase YbdK [compost metagenome]
MTDVYSGEQSPLVDDIQRLLENVAPWAEKLQASSAIDALARQLKQGHSEADRMREFIAEGGSLISLVEKHCEIWAA